MAHATAVPLPKSLTMSKRQTAQIGFEDWWFGHVNRWNAATEKTKAPRIHEFETVGMMSRISALCGYSAGYKAGLRSKGRDRKR